MSNLQNSSAQTQENKKPSNILPFIIPLNSFEKQLAALEKTIKEEAAEVIQKAEQDKQLKKKIKEDELKAARAEIKEIANEIARANLRAREDISNLLGKVLNSCDIEKIFALLDSKSNNLLKMHSCVGGAK